VEKNVKMGVFWEQLQKLGPTKGAWNHPKYLNHLHNPLSSQISFYLCAEGTLTLMTSGENGENGVFWEHMEELEHTQGAWNCPNCLKHFPKPQYCKSIFYLLAEGTLTLQENLLQLPPVDMQFL
jgi:hypothetical protein